MRKKDAISTILGLQGFFVYDHRLEGSEAVHLELRRMVRHYRCPKCGQLHLVPFDEHPVTVQDLPMSGRRVYLHFRKARVLCCRGQPQTEHLSWVAKNAQQTLRLRWAIYQECRHDTVKVVAERHGLSWDTVKSIDLEILQAQISRQKLQGVRRIAVDEIARARRHKYLTVVTDLDRGKVIWVKGGRKSKSFKEFFKARSSAGGSGVQVVAMDMWRPFIQAVQGEAPGARIVFNKFHVVQHLLKALDEVRRQEARRLEKQSGKELFRKRWVLLKNPENLKPEQQGTLSELLAENRALHSAYLLKEDFRSFYQMDFGWHRHRRQWNRIRQLAAQRLDGWIRRARESALGAFERFCKLLDKHRDGVLAYFIDPVSTALSEAMNSKINALKTRARGYRDLDYFILKIYQQCGLI